MKVIREGCNNYTELALASYVTAASAVEAFVNEVFLAEGIEFITRGSALWRLRRDWLERLELRDKIVLVTQLLFGHALDAGHQPLQDLGLLLKIRNAIVHYKTGAPPKYLDELVTRGIALGSEAKKKRPELGRVFGWDVASTEGIRWAHNTCCLTVHALVSEIPIDEEQHRERAAGTITDLDDFRFLHSGAPSSAGNFSVITDSDARSLYAEIGLDPDSNHP